MEPFVLSVGRKAAEVEAWTAGLMSHYVRDSKP